MKNLFNRSFLRKDFRFKTPRFIGCRLILFVFFSTTFFGCSSNGNGLIKSSDIGEIEVSSLEDFQPLKLNTVEVVPFFSVRKELINSNAITELNGQFSSVFNSVTNMSLHYSDNTEGKMACFVNSSLTIGQRLNCEETFRNSNYQGLLVGRLIYLRGDKTSYLEDDAIGFSVSLVRSRDQRVVWQANYRGDNKPLSDNLLRIAVDRVGFLSYSSLIKRGLERTATELQRSRAGI